MKMPRSRHGGFTLLEVMLVVAVLAVLATLAIVGYGRYTDRARSAEITTRYDAIRTGAQLAARVRAEAVSECDELGRLLDSSNLNSQYAALSYGYVAVPGGYRPVLNVCAQVGRQGIQGVHVARETHESLSRLGVVERDPVVMDSVVAFSLRLTDGQTPLCRVLSGAAGNSGCIASAGTSAGSTTASGTTQPQPAVTQPTASQPQSLASQAQPPASQAQPGVVQPQPPASQPQPQPQPGVVQPTRPPSQGSSLPGANTGVAPQRPQGQGANMAILPDVLAQFPEMSHLNKADRGVVAATAAMMATNTRYALVVRDALNATLPGHAVNIPTSAEAVTTLRFSAEMRSVLEIMYPIALREVCLDRPGPASRC